LEGNILPLRKAKIKYTGLITLFGLLGFTLISGILHQPLSVGNSNTAPIVSSGRDILARESQKQKIPELYFGKPGLLSFSEIYSNLGIKVYPEDIISAFPDPSYGIGSRISILRATSLTIVDAGEKKPYRTQKEKVGDFLNEKNIIVYTQDIITPGRDASINPDMEIVITRVAELDITETVEISYKTIKKEDSNLEKGKTIVKEKGKLGSKELTYHIRRENGKEVSRKLLDEKIISQPKDEIVMVGTKPAITVRCAFNDLVIQAAIKYNADPNGLCTLMMKESNGHPSSIGSGIYYGLFQYTLSFWNLVSSKAGNGSNIFDPRAQIFNTAWAITHGYRGRWP